jgi:hypothetical protein
MVLNAMAAAARKFGRGCLPIFRQNTVISAETMCLFIAAYDDNPSRWNPAEREKSYFWGGNVAGL